MQVKKLDTFYNLFIYFFIIFNPTEQYCIQFMNSSHVHDYRYVFYWRHLKDSKKFLLNFHMNSYIITSSTEPRKSVASRVMYFNNYKYAHNILR